MISFYQRYLSPLIHSLLRTITGSLPGCRYTPTCSEYFKIALKKHGVFKGSLMGISRILRCNPLFSGGVDNP